MEIWMNKILIMLCVLIPSASTSAARYSYELTGVITRVDISSTAITVGDSWSYTFIVDGDTPDSDHSTEGYSHFVKMLD
jgi:hypothetical protein